MIEFQIPAFPPAQVQPPPPKVSPLLPFPPAGPNGTFDKTPGSLALPQTDLFNRGKENIGIGWMAGSALLPIAKAAGAAVQHYAGLHDQSLGNVPQTPLSQPLGKPPSYQPPAIHSPSIQVSPSLPAYRGPSQMSPQSPPMSNPPPIQSRTFTTAVPGAGGVGVGTGPNLAGGNMGTAALIVAIQRMTEVFTNTVSAAASRPTVMPEGGSQAPWTTTRY